MKNTKTQKKAFTLIELLVVITIIAILASIALPVFTSVTVKANQTSALSNAKQIALALRLYSSDNQGSFPSYTLKDGQPTTTTVGSSNVAFAQLFPTYVQSEKIFWLAHSGWCNNNLPDEQTDPAGTDNPTKTLSSGENEWAYVLELNDSSNPSVPLLADGFADAGNHTYVKDPTQKGGVWKAQKAIIVHVDSSGVIATVNQNGGTYDVEGPNGGSQNGDIFTTSNGGNGWLGTGNTTVNPIKSN